VISAVAGPTEAYAQDAEEYFRRGVAALRTGNAEAATTMFEKAYALQPRAATLCNLALAYDRWGGHEELAAEAYARCAEEDSTGRFRGHAREREQELRAALRANAAGGTSDAAPPPPPPPEARIAPPGPAPTAPPPRPALAGPRVSPPPGGRLAPAPTAPMLVIRRLPPPPPERSHTLLWVGLGSGVLGAGALVVAIVTAQGVQADADYLDAEYDGGDRPIPAGSDDAEVLESARSRSDFSIALYAAGGALAALGVGLILADVARSDSPEPATAAIVPLPGGALATVRAPLP